MTLKYVFQSSLICFFLTAFKNKLLYINSISVKINMKKVPIFIVISDMLKCLDFVYMESLESIVYGF